MRNELAISICNHCLRALFHSPSPLGSKILNLELLKKLEAEATPGRWDWSDCDVYALTVLRDSQPLAICKGGSIADRCFIAATRNMLPRLIAVAEAAQSLMSEDDARDAMSHYNVLHILGDRLKELESE